MTMRTHESELQKVRDWNRSVLLALLNEKDLGFEKETPINNLKSQMAVRAALSYIKQLVAVAFNDPIPKTLQYANHSSIRRTHYDRFYEASEECNFIACRKILIATVRVLDVEQKYDLLYLLTYSLPPIFDDTCYKITCIDTKGENNGT